MAHEAPRKGGSLPPGLARRLVGQFEGAVTAYADLGAIPLWSDDPEEQAAIDRERRRLVSNYKRARTRLINVMEKL